jgi:hypothetical protein
MRIISSLFPLLLAFTWSFSTGQKPKATTADAKTNDTLATSTFSGLKFRSIGPAVTSGRIVDLAVNPVKSSEYYVASQNGGVWKTVNAGVTFQPVF